MKVKSLSRVRLFATPWTTAYQAPPSMGFFRQEYWSGVPLPSPVQSLSNVQFFEPPWTATRQASLSFTISWSALRLMSIKWMMPSNHLTIRKAEHQRIAAFKLWCWRRLLRVPWTVRRSNQSILKENSPEYSLEGLISSRTDWFDLLQLRDFHSLHIRWKD